MKILVTGFDPFAGEKVNPSLELLKSLPDTLAGADIVKASIPVVFQESAKALEQAISVHQPDVVVCLGQAGGRTAITPERVAINQDDAIIPDNASNQPIDMTIREDGAPAYFTTLPIKAMVAAMQEAGIPATVSNTAGTYVCNHLMYNALYLADKKFLNMKAGFIHIPFLPEQVVTKSNMASMNFGDMKKGILLSLETIISLDGKADLIISAGATH